MRILFRGSRAEFPLPPFIWTRSSLCFSRKQACHITTMGGLRANSINYISLRRNCMPYVFGFKGVSPCRVVVPRVCLARFGAVKTGRKKRSKVITTDPRQRYGKYASFEKKDANLTKISGAKSSSTLDHQL